MKETVVMNVLVKRARDSASLDKCRHNEHHSGAELLNLRVNNFVYATLQASKR